MRTLSVAIVGAGTAGMAAALFLARDGHRVTLYERVPVLAPVGAGLLLQPTGLAVLARLGLDEGIRACGARVERLFGTTAGGRTVLDLAYRDAGTGECGIGIHRGALSSVLATAVTAHAIELRLGTPVDGLEQDDERATVIGSAERREFDAVVVADGTFSRLRDRLRLRPRVAIYPWGAWWTIVPDRDRRFEGVLRQLYRGAREMLGIMPIGRSPHAPDDGPHVTVFWSIPCDEEPRLARRGLDAWKSEVLKLAPSASPLLDEVRERSHLLFATYADVRMDAWHDGRIAVIGDAAHATSPQLGQGANLALVDAAVLANAIRAHDSVPHALATYTARRRTHLAYYQWASRALTPLFQSDLRLLPFVRDLTMGAVCRMPLMRREMLATLAGHKTGLLRGRLDIDD